MNLKKRAMYAGMAAALALSLTVPTFAAANPGMAGTGVHDTPSGKGGETIISVIETKVDPENVSFEVPLYLTLAVVKDGTNDTKVSVPKNYYIKNSSAETGNKIGVTAMYISGIAKTGGWKLVDNLGTDATAKEMKLGLGKADKSGVLGFGPLNQGEWKALSMTGADNVFYTTANKYTPIAGGAKLDLGIDASVYTGYTTSADTAAAAQFRVTYVLSALDANNNPIGSPYAGDIYGPNGFAQLEDPTIPISRYVGNDVSTENNNNPTGYGTGNNGAVTNKNTTNP